MLHTSNQSKITLSVPGVTIDNRSWDKFSGGGRVAETQNYTPGGAEPSIAVSGVTKRNQATLERAYDSTLIGVLKALDGAVGEACSIGVQTLRNRTTTEGAQRTYTGIIREVNPPDNDSTSSNIQMLTVVVELNEAMS